METKGASLIVVAEAGDVDAEVLLRGFAELLVQAAGGDDEDALGPLDDRPRERRHGLAEARLPGENRAIVHRGAGEVFELELFEFHGGMERLERFSGSTVQWLMRQRPHAKAQRAQRAEK